MVKIAWCTDIHLDFLQDQKLIAFCESLGRQQSDGILITGDISNRSNLVYQLSVLERIVQRPIYFVLGNHDFYGGSIEQTRKEINKMCGMSQYMKYLSDIPYVVLSPTTALIGHDGWYDAGYGNIGETTFIMNDWLKIVEFASERVISPYMIPNYARIVEISRRQAQVGVMHVMRGIKTAAKYHNHIIIATHFPPFDECNVYNGKAATPGYKPWYSSKMMGDMLLQASNAYPNIKFEIFAGHTHGKVDVNISSNMNCHVGGSEYNNPQLQNMVIFP